MAYTTLNKMATVFINSLIYKVRQKSNPLSCFVNISTVNKNFCKKIYRAISHSYENVIILHYQTLHSTKLCHLNRGNSMFCDV